MQVLLVHAHPESDSFVAAMRDRLLEGFAARGDSVAVSDLYDMNFDPLLKSGDFGERRDPEHLVYALEQRHGWQTRSLAPDILAEVDKVLAADLLAFTFPVWWFGVPAILKGWIERVFLSGPFYGGRRVYGKGGLAGKRAFAACSLGGRPGMFGPGSIHGELEQGMLRHFFQGTLGYVGLAVHRPFVAWHVPYLDGPARLGLLDELSDCVAALDSRPTLAMPDLAGFDERLEPKEPPS